MRQKMANKRQRGFSIVELLIVVIIMFILLSIAVPSIMSITRSFRIGGDTRSISAQINLARMRAAADFTHARVRVDLNANTFRVEEWNKASGCWQADGGSTDCPQTTSPVTPLAQGDGFGFGSISAGPTAATSTIAQAPVCKVGDTTGPGAGANIANTACIEFNSRGYPVDSTNAIVASDAIYLTNNSNRYSAIAVSIAGQTTAYSYSGSSWAGL
jgi:prepilin-type N-terminal cleavage/methylation domain-containing protein